MAVKITQLSAKPTARYPYNYRVGFEGNLHECEQVGDWIEEQKLAGLTWLTSGNGGVSRVFYTTENPAMLCALRWS